MQTDYLFNSIRGYSRFKRFSYLFEMENTEANKRLKIIKFFDKYGLEATIEAFNVSRRTIYRYKATFKKNKENISSLNPKSTSPKQKRKPTIPKAIVNEIKCLREKYPNIGKAKLHVILKLWCEKNNLWEVRSKLASDKIARVIFTIYKDCMILLHGFIKKDQKLPEKEKSTAIERRKKIDTGECDE